MKSKSSLRCLALLSAACLLTAIAPVVRAANDTDKNAAAEKAKAAYPLTTCVVSGDALTQMGKPVEYTYKQAGQPDRLVLFCCKDCVADFEKNPAAYLKKIDDAAVAKAKEAPAPKH